jgi:hypothetical protein
MLGFMKFGGFILARESDFMALSSIRVEVSNSNSANPRETSFATQDEVR